MKKSFIIFFVSVFLGLQYRIWLGDGSLAQLFALKDMIKKERLANQSLSARNDKLDVEVRALKHQPQALEEHARSELGMIKKGETFYLVIDPRS